MNGRVLVHGGGAARELRPHRVAEAQRGAGAGVGVRGARLGGEREHDAQMLRTIIRIMKAFIIGKSEAVTAAVIFLSWVILPKSRMTRKARMSWTSQLGISSGPRSTSDMITMNTSKWFHPLYMNFSIQFA